MALKILGGVAKGLELKTPSGEETRPTSIMLKRRLFDSKQDFSESCFIDLCAGSGQVGLEALSRGAYEVYLVEKSPRAFQICKNNINLFNRFLNLGNATAIKADYLKWIEQFLKVTVDSDLTIFFDPPYENIAAYEKLFAKLEELKFKGDLVVEACQQKTMKLEQFNIKFPHAIKTFKQGTSFFNIYRF